MTRRDRMTACVEAVGSQYGVTVEEIMGESRKAWICRARFHAYAVINAGWVNVSYVQVGRFFNRDHTAIMNGLAQHFAHRFGERHCPRQRWVAMIEAGSQVFGNTLVKESRQVLANLKEPNIVVDNFEIPLAQLAA